jgi:thioredoxin-dependent peroxiredoxin
VPKCTAAYMADVITTLEVGMKAPEFSTLDSEGTNYSLKELNDSGKTVILYFYPKDNTPGCTKQACDFRDEMGQLQRHDCIVLGVSKDTAKSHDKFTSKYDLNFPLLLDEEREIHIAYGVWREKMNYGRKFLGCCRSTFVISPDGNLKWVGYNVRAKGHVAKLLRELEFE